MIGTGRQAFCIKESRRNGEMRYAKHAYVSPVKGTDETEAD